MKGALSPCLSLHQIESWRKTESDFPSSSSTHSVFPFSDLLSFLPLRPDISGINKKWFLLPPLSLASSGLLPGSLGGRKLTILHTTQRKGRSSQAGERRGEGINRPRNGWLLFHYIAPLPSQLKPRPWLEVVSIDDAPAVYKRTQLVCWESEEGFLRTRELR